MKNLSTPGLMVLMLLTAPSTMALDRVEISISDSARGILEANPYFADKVPAIWTAGGDSTSVSVSFRGAYSLRSQLEVPNGPDRKSVV